MSSVRRPPERTLDMRNASQKMLASGCSIFQNPDYNILQEWRRGSLTWWIHNRSLMTWSLHTSDVTKVLLLGNPGIGKSWWLNAVAGKKIFESKWAAESVTREMEIALIKVENGKYFALYNMPGFLEHDDDRTAQNIRCIEQAFRCAKSSPTVVVFMLQPTGGRLPSAADMAVFKNVARFVPEMWATQPTAFVINNVNILSLGGEGELSRYTESAKRQIAAATATSNGPMDFQVELFASMPALTDLQLADVGRKAISLLCSLSPTPMDPAADSHISAPTATEVNKIAEALKLMQEKLDEERAKHQEQQRNFERHVKELRERDEARARKSDILGGIMTVGGLVVGGIVAGLPGALAGAALGSKIANPSNEA